jgi:glucokinase
MNNAVLVADIGGTKSWVSLFIHTDNGGWQQEAARKYLNQEFGDPYPLLMDFLSRLEPDRYRIESAGLAVAGPVHDQVADLTNLPWTIDVPRLKRQLDLDQLLLINDFQAAAHGISLLEKEDLVCLNDVSVAEDGLAVITGAGTGLGLALMGKCVRLLGRAVHPTEAGHADYAPANEQQLRLSNYLHETMQMGRVSWETLLSGHGLVLLDAFVRDQDHPVLKTPETVTAAAERKDISARHAIRLFWDIYAAWIGNVALMYRPLGGLYLFGGMAMRLKSWFEPERFMQEASSRTAMQDLVRETPIFLVTDEQLALKGTVAAVNELFY